MGKKTKFGPDDETHEGVVNLLLHFEQEHPDAFPDPQIAIDAALEITGPQGSVETPIAKGLDPDRLDDLAMNPKSDQEASLFMQLMFAGQR